MIHNAPQILTNPGQAAETSVRAEKSLPLQRNEKVVGVVLKSYTPGKALVSIKGQKVHVLTHVPLHEGSQVTLQVRGTDPAPIFQFLGEVPPGGNRLNLPEILSAVKGNLWKMTMDATLRSNAGPEEKNSIVELLEKVTISLDRAPSSDHLRSVVQLSGLSLEAKIKKGVLAGDSKAAIRKLVEHDLKGLLSKLMGSGMEGRGHLKKLVNIIERIQVLNLDGLEQGGKIYIPLPMQLPDGFFSVVELLLHLLPGHEEKPGERTSNEDAFKATILLEMSRLGPIRAEFILRGESVEGMILVTTAKAKEVLEKNLFSFTEILNNRGFLINHVGCFLKSPEIVARPLLKEIVAGEEGSICLVG